MSNPRIRSHQHRKAPSMMFWRTMRGMLPNKTARGLDCLRRLKCFDGIPRQFFDAPRYKVPHALACTIYKPARKPTTLGDWKHGVEVEKLETIRKEKATERYEAKK